MISEATTRRIASAYFDGDMPVPEIASAFGIGERRLYRLLRGLRAAGVEVGRRIRPSTSEEEAEIVRLYSAGGITMVEVSRRVRRSHHYVGAVLRRHGVRTMSFREAMKYRRHRGPTPWRTSAEQAREREEKG